MAAAVAAVLCCLASFAAGQEPAHEPAQEPPAARDGRIVGPLSEPLGEPLVNVEVVASNELFGGEVLARGRSDAEGVFVLAHLPVPGGGNVFPIAFGWACFPVVGQPFLDQSSCTTGMVSF